MKRLTLSRGFTLIELLIVLAIIGILASVVLGNLGSARDKAQVATAQAELQNILKAMELLRADTGYYANGDSSNCRTSPPSNNEVDLSAAGAGLTANGGAWAYWQGPYLPDAIDPWGTPYYMDEDYQCLAATSGCDGVTDGGQNSSVLVSCGPNADNGGSGGSCNYDADNIVIVLCKH